MAGNGNGKGKRVEDGTRSKDKEPSVSYFPTSSLEAASSSNIATLNARTLNCHDLTVCPVCSKEMENPLICMNTLVLCPHCNEILLVSDGFSISTYSQQKFLSPLSSEISPCPFPKYAPVCTLGQQYDLALAEPRYFHIILEFVSIIKNKPFRVPVLFQGKEVNIHRMFVEVTCRGGIFMVCQERRLQEVSAALTENLSDSDLYNIYMIVLYELETWVCRFPYEGHIPLSPPLTTNPHDLTVCPLCHNKTEKPMSCMNTIVLCPHCNDILLVSENSQGKFLTPLSSDISGCPSPKNEPVCTPRQQYDLAREDPHYFHIMLELVSSIKNKPSRVPVIFQRKELNVHRMFVEVTCRGGILKVTQERRLQEVSVALAENLSDRDLYEIYMVLLYDLESWLCHFPPAPPLRPCSSYHKTSLMPKLREEQHPSQWIQALTPYKNAATMNNNQQWTSLPAGFNNSCTDHLNRSSSRPCPMPVIILKGGQPSSSNLNPAVPNNNPMWITESSGSNYNSNFDSADHRSRSLSTSYPVGPTQGFIGQPSEWIKPSAPYKNSEPVKNNQQLASFHQTGVNFGSTYHSNGPSSNLNSAVANNNQVWTTASNFKCNSSLGSEDHTSSSLPPPHPIQGLMGGQASEQGIHEPSQNQRMMMKRKELTESLEPVKKVRMLSSHLNR
ncbi:hypothetical protein V6N13_020321 [Hibiscus sabdariffa]